MRADVFVLQLQGGLDPSSAGAKAGNLARVMGMGLSVPPGRVVTRQALSLFLEQSGLLPRAERLVSDTRLDDTARVAEYEALCEEVLKAPIPQPVIEAVTPMARALFDESPDGLAVRSSGVHEDSAKASFAGVYQSFLGIRCETDLWLAVRRCWCASWAPPAIDYARRMGIQPAVDGMGVLVQRLVRADRAGVLFTADPLTGNPWRFVLHAAFGLARDVVGGQAEADELVLDWDSDRVLEKRVVEKPVMLAATPQGVRQVELPETRRKEPSLADPEAHKIAQVARTLDRAFGCRVDVEWALAGNALYVVQVRPIAALPQFFPHELKAEEAEQTWERSVEGWYNAPPQDARLVAPLFADEWALERWQRYAPPPLLTLAVDVGQLARFERLLDWARYWGPALNDRTLAVLLFSRLQEVVWRTGLALYEEGITETADEVHLLSAADLRQIAGSRQRQASRALSQTRRREFDRNQRLTAPAFLGTKPASEQSPISSAPTAARPAGGDGPVLSGQSWTPWNATGVARIAKNLSDAALLASLAPETILVCDGSSISYYADWASLFLVVTGLVIVGQHGGMHHAIQIARECGVAFVQLPEAELSRLQDGARIEVDGAAGTVRLPEEYS